MSEVKRIRRTPAQIKADKLKVFDEKIKALENKVNQLKAERDAFEKAPLPVKKLTKKEKMKKVMDAAKKAGKTPEEIAEALGLEIQ